MGSFIYWLTDHWHSLVESAGIIGGLIFTGVTVRRDLEARRVTEYLTLATQHRRLWGQLHRRKSLSRLLEPSRDLSVEPISREELNFVSLAFVHFHTSWLISREASLLLPLPVLAADAGHFFRLPAPRAAWELERRTHQPEFVAFIEAAIAANLAASGRPSSAS